MERFGILMRDFSQASEAEVRYNLIDPLLVKAGWNIADRAQISFEVLVDGDDALPLNGVTDYSLFWTNGKCSQLHINFRNVKLKLHRLENKKFKPMTATS